MNVVRPVSCVDFGNRVDVLGVKHMQTLPHTWNALHGLTNVTLDSSGCVKLRNPVHVRVLLPLESDAAMLDSS